MTDENVSPVTVTTAAEFQKDLAVKAGAGMIQEPTNVETTDQVEDTTIINAVEAPDAPAEDGGDTKHSSKQIAELGEDRKRLASELIDLARGSDVAADKVRQLISDDPKMEKLIKTKFGEDYDRLMNGDPLPQEEVDLDKIKEEARVEARAEILLKEAEATREKQFNLFAQSYGLNSEEADRVKENATLLEGKYEFEQALGLALQIVNAGKANAGQGKVEIPKGGTIAADPEPNKIKVTPEFENLVKRVSNRSPEDVAKGIQRVEEYKNPDGSYTFRSGI